MSRGTDRDLFVYVTHDGGETWTLSAGTALGSGSVDFSSMNDGFAWSPKGFMQVTRNAGNSWSQVSPNVNFGDNAPQIEFVSSATGWLLQNPVNGTTPLYRTTDGGTTWTVVSGGQPGPPLPDLTITGMRIELQNPGCLAPDDPMGVRVTIANNGQAAAGSFVLRVNGIDQTVNGLGIGETAQIFLPGSSNPVTAIVDLMNTVTESAEQNNSRTEMLPIPTPPLPCLTQTATPVSSPTEFIQAVVSTLNAKDFSTAKALMEPSFTMAFWQSQGTSYPPHVAIQQLQTNYIGPNTSLIPDLNKDLNALLGGMNPYSIMGLDASNSQALFVSGWGLNGNGEAILYVTRRTDGSLYWHSVLIASAGFASNPANAFCSDARIPALIEQLKATMNQSNGEMFAGLVSPTGGVNVRLWAYSSEVNLSASNARNVFTSSDSYNWGGGPSGTPDIGSFKDIIQPKLLEVLNAPNMETYCDNLTNVFPLSNPWPYPNIHYYNLYKPATPGVVFDFRTWLIGFEYVNDQPYLHSMVTIVWEP
jgi:hypothetical protein